MPASSSGGRVEKPTKRKDQSIGSRFSILDDYTPTDASSISHQKRRRNEEEVLTNSFFNKNQKLKDLLEGPKFLIMSRNDGNGETMKNISPFFIEKAIKLTSGEVKQIKRMRDGTLLIETFTRQQADKLKKMVKLYQHNVIISEHPRLNSSKGLLTCTDFEFLTDEEILEGFKDQYVTDIRRLKRKINDNFVNTASLVATFSTTQPPVKVKAGFISINVRPYIPLPLRCFNCQQFGHSSNNCKKETICGKCALPQHTDECKSRTICYNCTGDHPAWAKVCDKFKEEFEVQKIKTLERKPYIEARKIYKERNPMANKFISFSQIVRENPATNITVNKEASTSSNSILNINAATSRNYNTDKNYIQPTTYNQKIIHQQQIKGNQNTSYNDQIPTTSHNVDMATTIN